MFPWNNPRASSGEEIVSADGQHQHHARPRQVRSRRRRSRQTTSDLQGRDEARALQVYRFRSRAPSTSVHCSGEGSLGLSRIPTPTEDRKNVKLSASYWVHQEPARCWVRDCTGLACSAAGCPSRTHLLQSHCLGEEDHLTSLMEEFFSIDGGNDGIGESGTASFQADVTSDNASRSLAEEYSLAPLNTQKKYSAQSFDQEVANYFKRL